MEVLTNLKSYDEAKKEIAALQHYIDLIDNYVISNLEELIIYKYALHNSISKVIRHIKNSDYLYIYDTNLVTHNYITSVILGDTLNDLHAIVKKHYKEKTRPQRKRSRNNNFFRP